MLQELASGVVNVVLATEALTHGLNEHVDHVLMYTVTHNMTILQQRIGRANRFGTTGCTKTIAVRLPDVWRWKRILGAGSTRTTQKFDEIVKSVLTFNVCRHVQLSTEFYIKPTTSTCNKYCDVCRGITYDLGPKLARQMKVLIHRVFRDSVGGIVRFNELADILCCEFCEKLHPPGRRVNLIDRHWQICYIVYTLGVRGAFVIEPLRVTNRRRAVVYNRQPMCVRMVDDDMGRPLIDDDVLWESIQFPILPKK